MASKANPKRLTQQMVERVAPPTDGRLEINDAACPGLILRVTKTGRRSYSVIYKVVGEGGVNSGGRLLTGRQHRITLGRHPFLSLPDAREKARQIVAAADGGRDTRAELQQQYKIRIANTVSSVSQRFLRTELQPSIQSWKNAERIFRNHVVPVIGGFPIRDIDKPTVHELLDNLVAIGKVGTAREVKKHLHRFFEWAVDRDIAQVNPLYRMRRLDLAPNPFAGRALSDEELRAVWRASNDLGTPFGPYYRLVLLTGQRRAEWANAKKSEVNSTERTLEIGRSRQKSRRDHIVPLSNLAFSILESLPSWGWDGEYLISSTFGRRPISGFSKAKAELDQLATGYLSSSIQASQKIDPYRLHDLRVTCETRLAKLGFGQDVRDAVLGHAKTGLQATYNKYDYLKEKGVALETYAKHIQELTK